MHIFSFYAESLDKSCVIFLGLALIFLLKVLATVKSSNDLVEMGISTSRAIDAVHKVKLANLIRT
jgi:hypothetical protein